MENPSSEITRCFEKNRMKILTPMDLRDWDQPREKDRAADDHRHPFPDFEPGSWSGLLGSGTLFWTYLFNFYLTRKFPFRLKTSYSRGFWPNGSKKFQHLTIKIAYKITKNSKNLQVHYITFLVDFCVYLTFWSLSQVSSLTP